MSPTARSVWEHAHRIGLLRPNDAVLLAVSGGADSMAMMHLFREIADIHRLTLTVGHVHHGLRGRDADDDMRFVRRSARALGLPFRSRTVDIPRIRRATGGSIEETARRERYRVLASMQTSCRARVIATAHHADDQIETVLMRARRGTDLHGLAGILPERSDPPVVRPLLTMRRRTLRAYLSSRGITWRSDGTNSDLLFERNSLRASLRAVDTVGPSDGPEQQVPLLADLALRLRRLFEDALAQSPGVRPLDDRRTWALATSFLGSTPEAVRESVVAFALRRAGVPLSRERVASVLRLMHGANGKKVVFSGSGIAAVRDRTEIVLTPQQTPSRRPEPLAAGSPVAVDGGSVRLSAPQPPPHTIPSRPTEAWIDADRIRLPLIVRPWKAGDVFVPLGMRGSKNVSDYLTDARVPLYKKARVPVVLSGRRIVWICGLRTDDRFKITSRTRRVVQLSYHSSV